MNTYKNWGEDVMKSRDERATISEFVLGQLPPEEALRFLDRIEADPHLSAEVEDCAMLLQVVGKCGDTVFSEKRTGPWLLRDAPGLVPESGHASGLAGYGRYVALGVVMVLLLALPWISEEISGPYSDLASVTGGDVALQMRGEDARDLVHANRLLQDGQYDQATALLESYLRVTNPPVRREYAAYLLGGAYLLSARKSAWGLFPTYDHERIAAGMGYLMEVVQEGGSGRLVQEARWLRAKGCLMIGHPDAALDEVSGILLDGGSRYTSAAALTGEIRRRSTGR